MHMKNIVSAGALAIALGLAGPAIAQTETAMPTMIGNQALSAADAERVKVYCEDLQNDANQAVGASSADTASNDDDDASEGTEDADNTSDTAAVGTVDMDLITVESCAEAGFTATVAQ